MPKGLISGVLNKGIAMRGFWSGFKLNFYKKKSHCSYKRQEIVHSSWEAFQYKAIQKFPIFVSGHIFQNEKI